MQDPVITEVRTQKEALAGKFQHDVRRLAAYLEKRQTLGHRKVVKLPPRKPKAA